MENEQSSWVGAGGKEKKYDSGLMAALRGSRIHIEEK